MVRRFAQLRIDVAEAEGPQCPPETVWLGVAARSTTESLEDYLSHAAECDHCGPLLRGAVEDFADELTPGEQAGVMDLGSSTPEWRNSLVVNLVSRAHPQESGLIENPARSSPSSGSRVRRPWFRTLFTGVSPKMRWASAACFALLLIASAIVWRRDENPEGRKAAGSKEPGEAISVADVNRMLAQAYSDRRTFDLRIPGANPPRIYRGDNASADRPQSLNEAEDVIGKHLSESPSDLVWIQAKGRSDLLDGNYQAAISRLEPVVKAHPKLIEACTDLATAYYLRGQQLHNEIDSASAYTLLNTVLDQKPNDLIALFNRALIEQDLQSYTDTQEDWKRYLQLAPASPWADVARAQLSSIENTTGGQHGVLRPPGPARFCHRFRNRWSG